MTANIIMALAILVFVGPVAWLTLRWLGGIIVRQSQVAAHRKREPETHGNRRNQSIETPEHRESGVARVALPESLRTSPKLAGPESASKYGSSVKGPAFF